MIQNIINKIKEKKKIMILLIFIMGAFLLIILKLNNPEKVNFFPPCIFYKITGIKCAGCGLTRATHYLLNMQIKKAFLFNPLLFIYLIFALLYIFIYSILKKNNKKMQKINMYFLYFILFFTIIFMIIRNFINI